MIMVHFRAASMLMLIVESHQEKCALIESDTLLKSCDLWLKMRVLFGAESGVIDESEFMKEYLFLYC